MHRRGCLYAEEFHLVAPALQIPLYKRGVVGVIFYQQNTKLRRD